MNNELYFNNDTKEEIKLNQNYLIERIEYKIKNIEDSIELIKQNEMSSESKVFVISEFNKILQNLLTFIKPIQEKTLTKIQKKRLDLILK